MLLFIVNGNIQFILISLLFRIPMFIHMDLKVFTVFHVIW